MGKCVELRGGSQRRDSIQRKRGRESPIADLDAGRAKPVHPAWTPPTILALQGQQLGYLALQTHTDGHPREYPHGERQRVAGRTGSLEDALTQERGELSMQACVATGPQELRGKEEKALRSQVVASTLEVGSVLQDPQHPFEGAVKLVSAAT